MIVNNSALGFSKSRVDCDCRFSQFSLPVALADNTYWQVDIVCDEITGTNIKLPCESNQIGPYTEDFARYQNDIGPEALLPTYLISSTDIRFEDFEAAGNIFSTPVGFLPANRCFWLRYTISGYSDGYLQTVVDASETQRTSGINPSREANGTYSEIYCTDSDGRLRFQVGNDDNTGLSTFILSNIFLGCIRYSELYELTTDPADADLVTFGGQTNVCKEATTNTVLMSLRTVPFIEGQTYKICFNISGSTEGSVDLLFNSTTPDTYSGNGFYCTELEYEDGTLVTRLEFEMSIDFNGCIGDISVHLIAEYRAELFDTDGNEVQVDGESALQIEQIGNALKININPSIIEGCYSIGIADNCSNFMNQFYGNIIDADGYYSEPILIRSLPNDYHWGPIIKTGNNLSFELFDFATLGSGVYTSYFLVKDSICYNKLYDGEFTLTLDDNGNDVVSIEVYVLAAGKPYSVKVNAPGPLSTYTFDDIISAVNEAEDDSASFLKNCPSRECDIIGHNSLAIIILTEVNSNNTASPTVSFTSGIDSMIFMDQDTPQFCPEYFSVGINFTAAAPCDTVLVKYRNPNNAFGFDYTSAGFTEADDFFNQIRIPGKLWKPNYPRTKEIQKASTGYRTNYYSDVDKKQTLTTGLLPEFVHDALSDAVEHETLIIEGNYFVCDSEDYTPSWEKSTELASVELELFVQQARKLNTKC